MKDSIYFRHDYNARNDGKIIKLRMKYGWEGFGLFWATIEIFREQSNGMQTHSDCISNAFQLHYDGKRYAEFIDFCLSIDLLKKDKKDNIYSPRLLDDVEYMHEKSKTNSKSAKARWEKRKKQRTDENANALQTDSERNANAMPNKIREDSIDSKGEEYTPPRNKLNPFDATITQETSLLAITIEDASWVSGMADQFEISEEEVIKKAKKLIASHKLKGNIDTYGHERVKGYIVADWNKNNSSVSQDGAMVYVQSLDNPNPHYVTKEKFDSTPNKNYYTLVK